MHKKRPFSVHVPKDMYRKRPFLVHIYNLYPLRVSPSSPLGVLSHSEALDETSTEIEKDVHLSLLRGKLHPHPPS